MGKGKKKENGGGEGLNWETTCCFPLFFEGRGGKEENKEERGKGDGEGWRSQLFFYRQHVVAFSTEEKKKKIG